MRRVRTAVFVSGRGSNLDALLAAAKDPAYPAEIVLAVSNNPDAGGLDKARAVDVPTAVFDHRLHKGDREAHERAIDNALKAAEVELIALAGYMRVLTPWLVDEWQGRMINIHPSLLPLLPGLHTHARALAEGHKTHGCTVHWVTAGVDEGPIVGQAVVEVLPGDDEDALTARVLEAEHRLYPECLAKAALVVRER